MTRVLVLRPEPGASATVERARRHGLDAISVPLFTVEPMAWAAPDLSGFDALLLTSANAVRHGGEGLAKLRVLPVHAVGAATAEAARDAGFDIATIGSDGVDRLLASLDPDAKLLHLCGEERLTPVNARQAIAAVAVYRASVVPNPKLDNAGSCVALIHSPRAGRRFAELVGDRSRIAIAAVSRASADAAGDGWAKVEAAESPDDDALLALAARLCNNLPGT
jgi:uroporphyrinogen-III synthase